MNEQKNNMTVENNVTNTPAVEDKGSFGWVILGFFFPLIGFILFLVWINSKKKSAKQALIGAVVSAVLIVAFYLICWPMIQRSVVTKTCQLYNEKYEGIKIDDTQINKTYEFEYENVKDDMKWLEEKEIEFWTKYVETNKCPPLVLPRI